MGKSTLFMAKMASTLSRVCVRGSQLLKNTRAITGASRAISISAWRTKEWEMSDPLDHATGLEKYELLAKQAGNDDPFFMKVRSRGKGTKDDPNIVDALDNFRMVGCVCNEIASSSGQIQPTIII